MKSHSIGSISLALTAISFFGLTTPLPAAAATFYNVLDLGFISEFDSVIATGINDLGQVVGESGNNNDGPITFRTAPNSPINPATDNIEDKNPLSNSFLAFSNDVNNSGEVVATFFGPGRSNIGYRTDANGLLTKNLLPVDESNAINDSGQIAGTGRFNFNSSIQPPFLSAVRVDNSNNATPTIIDLGNLRGSNRGSSRGNGINELGQVVGSSSTTDGQTHAFRTAPNSVINAATDDLGTLGGSSSTALDINDLGQVVGRSTTASGETHAFLTGANSAINAATDDLGTLGGSFSVAYSINESGFVVGDSELADGSDRAFVYDGTDLFDLNTLIPGYSGFVLIRARGINESGQIAVNGFFDNSTESRAFLLTPVPEPTTMLGLLAFSAGAGFLRKRAKRKLKV